MKRTGLFAAIMLAAALVGSAGCSTPRSGSEIDVVMNHAMRSSTERMAQGNAIESFQLAHAVSEVDPDYPGVQAALAGLPADLENLFNNSFLGSNVAIRQPIDVAWYEHVLWYIPDRILDVFDIVSFDVHLGFGLWVDAHVTRAVQFAFGARSVAGLGWHDHRSLGVLAQAEAGFNILPFGVEVISGFQAGTSGVQGGSFGEGGLHMFSSPLYRDFRDYWAIGGGATVLFAGAEADVHPVEIADFIVGLFFFDPLNDDFGSTTGVDFSSRERSLMRSLSEISANQDEIDEYLLWREREHGQSEVIKEVPVYDEGPDEVL